MSAANLDFGHSIDRSRGTPENIGNYSVAARGSSVALLNQAVSELSV